jgi:hypothetical protein
MLVGEAISLRDELADDAVDRLEHAIAVAVDHDWLADRNPFGVAERQRQSHAASPPNDLAGDDDSAPPFFAAHVAVAKTVWRRDARRHRMQRRDN